MTEAVPPDAPPTRHARNRLQIVEAAADCFERLSLRQTSMEEVARAAGMSRQTLYRHFANKEELIAAVSEKKARGVTDLVNHRIQNAQEPRTRIATAITACVECLVTDRQMREMVDGDYKELMLRACSPGIVAITEARWRPILDAAVAAGIVAADADIPRLISWITDIEILLAMRVIVLGLSLDEVRVEVERHVMPGLCRPS